MLTFARANHVRQTRAAILGRIYELASANPAEPVNLKEAVTGLGLSDTEINAALQYMMQSGWLTTEFVWGYGKGLRVQITPEGIDRAESLASEVEVRLPPAPKRETEEVEGSLRPDLRSSDELCLGVSTGEGEAEGPILLSAAGVMGHIEMTGGIGCGKSATVMLPLLYQAIVKYPETPERRWGMFVIDASGELTRQIQAFARAAGREEDLWVLSPEGSLLYNPLDKGSRPALALAETLLNVHDETQEGPSASAYWRGVASEFLTHLITLLRVSDSPVNVRTLHSFISPAAEALRSRLSNEGVSWRRGRDGVEESHAERVLKRQVEQATEFFRDFDDADSSRRDDVLRYLAEVLRTLRTPEVEELVSPQEATFAGFDAAIDEGKIVVLRLPWAEYGLVARQIGMLAISDFLNAARRRLNRPGANQERRMALFLDRAEPYVGRELVEALPMLRQARTFAVLSYLSRDEMKRGPEGRARVSGLQTHIATKLFFSPPNMRMAEDVSRSLGERVEMQQAWWKPFQREVRRSPYFTPPELLDFRMGEFALVRFTGEGLEAPVRVKGIPAFKDPEIAPLL